MHSVYHFFRSLVLQKSRLKTIRKLDRFPFMRRMLSCRNDGVFPDLAIRLNKQPSEFTGGELVELKDSDSYTVSSFNSTIPSRSKKISDIITGKQSVILTQMEGAGDDVFSLPVREVFYLVRGKKQEKRKVCLVYGSFFETVGLADLISQSFLQVLEERLKESGKQFPEDMRQTLASLFSQQENFSKVRIVDKASVKLRFRIMTEVKAEGNILDSEKYPEIKDDTLNLVLPCHNSAAEVGIREKFANIFNENEMEQFRIFKMKHHFNGWFLVFQIDL